jgi:hypothetical protein
LCSTNGTTGYNGTMPFNLSTITSWFQVDASTSHLAGQPAQPANAGDFLVVNNTGVTVTGLTLTITDTFTSSTPSVGPCTGSQTGSSCERGVSAGEGCMKSRDSATIKKRPAQGFKRGPCTGSAFVRTARTFMQRLLTEYVCGGSVC